MIHFLHMVTISEKISRPTFNLLEIIFSIKRYHHFIKRPQEGYAFAFTFSESLTNFKTFLPLL